MSEVSCRATAALLDAVASKGIARSSLLEGTGLELSVLEDVKSSISWDDFVAVMERVDALGDEAFLDDLARRLHEFSENRPISALARYVWSESQFWRMVMHYIGPALFSPVTFLHEPLGGGGFRVTARIPSTHRGSESFLRFLVGLVRAGSPAGASRGPVECRVVVSPRVASVEVLSMQASGVFPGVLRVLGGLVLGNPTVAELERRHASARRTTEELERRNQFLASLQAVASSITQSLDFAGVAQRIVDAVAAHTEFPAVVLYSLSACGTRLELTARRDPSASPGTSLPPTLPLEAGLGGGRFEPDRVMWVPGQEAHAELHPAIGRRLGELGMQAAVLVPLHFHGDVVGALGLAAPHRRNLDPGDEDSLLALGQTAAAALMSARHVARIEREVAERSRAQAELRQSQERLREVAENVEGVFYLLDAQTDELLYLSPKFEDFAGHPRAPLEEDIRNILAWIHPDDRERMIEASGPTGDPREYDLEYRFIRSDGEIMQIHERVSLVRDSQGKAIRILGFVQDVTRTRELEHQLLHSQKMELVGRMAGGIAHDFNNLLTVISGYGELLRDRFPPGEIERTSSEEILRASERASALTRRLLTLARKQPLKAEALDLGSVVEEIAPMLRSLVGEAVQVAVDLDPGPLPVVADRGLLEQVLVNLAVNARDAMPDGGVLSIETWESSPEHVGLRVTDDGAGMPPSVQSRAFEPFFSTKEPGQGTGLGLATVQGIVDEAGGHIRVRSEPGKGSVFEIELQRFEGAVPAADSAAPRARGGRETLLLVEDQEDVREVASRALRERGYRVIEAEDARHALTMALDTEVSLLVTDVVMPGMRGTELAERLEIRRPGLPVLFLSGYTEDEEEILESKGAFLAKPFTPEALAFAVRGALDARPGVA